MIFSRIGSHVSAFKYVPNSPTSVVATASNGQASVSFTLSSSVPRPITGYTVTSSPGGFTGTGATSPIVVTGLTNGTAYTFTVTATSSAGTSSASVASNSVVPAILPSAPTSVSATAGAGQATVTFTPGAAGSSPTTSYTVTSSPGGITATGTASPIVITGLTVGTAYTFTVAGVSIGGTGAASTASNSVTPTSAKWIANARISDSPNNQFGANTTTDSSGNVYQMFNSNGSYIILVKYDQFGTLQWKKQILGKAYEQAIVSDGILIALAYTPSSSYNTYLIKIDFNGNLSSQVKYNKVIGPMNEFRGRMYVGPTGRRYIYMNGTVASSNYSGAHRIVAMDSGNSIIWQRQEAGSANTYFRDGSMVEDSAGNVFHAFANYNSTSYQHSSLGVVKYDSSGNVLWSYQYNSGSDDYVYGMVLDSSNNVYVSLGGSQIAKIDNSGTLLWVKSYNLGGTLGIAAPWYSDDHLSINSSNQLYISVKVETGAGSPNYISAIWIKFDTSFTVLNQFKLSFTTNQRTYPYSTVFDNGSPYMYINYGTYYNAPYYFGVARVPTDGSGSFTQSIFKYDAYTPPAGYSVTTTDSTASRTRVAGITTSSIPTETFVATTDITVANETTLTYSTTYA